MTKEQIFQLFQQPYNQTHWKQFLGETFPHARLLATPETLTGIDTSVASHTLKLGHIVLNENGIERHIAIYEVQLQPGIVLERNRVGLRNLLRKYWKNIDAAFIVYHNPDISAGPARGKWRFSYVSELTGFDADGNFQKIQTEPKRYTYVLGEGENVRTAADRFFILIQKAGKATLDDVKEAFSVEKVTKEFYTEVAQWYEWALQHVKFPKDAEAQENGRNIAVIRLLTRLFFIWFMKEKELIPTELFDEGRLKNILKNFNPSDTSNGNYYKAILQNLFFATLNTPIEQRKFRREESYQGKNPDYMNHQYYRYHNLFKDPDQNLQRFKDIPFLNGGLFECLDLPKDDPNNPTGREIRIDGYSDVPEKQAFVPNHLFFHPEKGILSIFKKYHFTIEENTPFDQQVSLDPEMLGKVFENLLATYNPETRETARKATGSFYTPREIVYYMVKESLKEYFKNKLHPYISDNLDNRLEQLFSYTDTSNPFNEEETLRLIEAIHQVKILDPAVGSGAFPMEAINQMVHLLSKLDPHNALWKKQQKQVIEQSTLDPSLKQKTLEHIENIFSHNELGYGRKLFLIQNCLYGVDIQPIAIHIAKLRFFLSLLVDEKINDQLPNKGIEPLPNLETKLIAANTLMALPKRNGGLQLPQIEALEQQLFQLRQRYFEVSDQKEKEKIKNEDRRLRLQIQQQMKNGGFPSEFADAIAAADIYDTQASHPWFDPEWMLGVKDGFNVVIGNPPYISTKGVNETTKKNLEKQYGFADDTYNHFYFKGIELLRENGILAYISSKTFWTIQTKKNLRELLLRNKILQLFDTANPFESAMVDTCVVLVQKQKAPHNNRIIFLDGRLSFEKPETYTVNQQVYATAPNQVIFTPSPYNMKIYERLGKTVNVLLNQWWDKISTSKNIEKYKKELEAYRNQLKPGDITLLGLITEGGQGLATANNGKYVGVLDGTKWAENVRKQRPKKLLLASEFCKQKGIKNKTEAQKFLEQLDEKEIRHLFDELKQKYGRDIFGQGWLYRIVSPDEIADVEKLTDNEKLNGISGNKTFVPYDKGDKDGNRWYAPTPYYIDWSRENVKFLQNDPKARWQGYQFYFREGFCWSDIHTINIKCRIKAKGIHDVKSMSLFSLNNDKCPEFYFVCLLNSTFISEYIFSFVKNTQTFQINDARIIPIIIPTPEQLKEFERIFDAAYAIQKDKFAGRITEKKAEEKLQQVQEELDEMVEEMYMGSKTIMN